MPLVERRSPEIGKATPGEQAAALSMDEASEAVKADRSEGDFAKRQPDNLSIVEYGGLIVEHSSDPGQFITRAKLDRMSAPEIRAVGHDRGYWRRGVSLATKAQIVEKFIEMQGPSPLAEIERSSTAPVIPDEPAPETAAPPPS